MPSGATTKKEEANSRRKRRKKKAAKLWGFAAWYVRDGVGFNGSLVPGLGFSAKLMGEYLNAFANFMRE